MKPLIYKITKSKYLTFYVVLCILAIFHCYSVYEYFKRNKTSISFSFVDYGKC